MKIFHYSFADALCHQPRSSARPTSEVGQKLLENASREFQIPKSSPRAEEHKALAWRLSSLWRSGKSWHGGHCAQPFSVLNAQPAQHVGLKLAVSWNTRSVVSGLCVSGILRCFHRESAELFLDASTECRLYCSRPSTGQATMLHISPRGIDKSSCYRPEFAASMRVL